MFCFCKRQGRDEGEALEPRIDALPLPHHQLTLSLGAMSLVTVREVHIWYLYNLYSPTHLIQVSEHIMKLCSKGSKVLMAQQQTDCNFWTFGLSHLMMIWILDLRNGKQCKYTEIYWVIIFRFILFITNLCLWNIPEEVFTQKVIKCINGHHGLIANNR